MGWDGDDIMLRKVPKLLGELYAGCIWSAATSFSPVIVRHRKGMTDTQRSQIVVMFPEHIRVEFQETELKANISRIYGFDSGKTEAILAFWGTELGAEEVKSSMLEMGLLPKETSNEVPKEINENRT